MQVTIPTNTIADAPAHAVYLKQRWADAWVRNEYLFALEVKKAALPDISQATLDWRYGQMVQHNTDTYSSYTPLLRNGWYAKIVIDPGGDEVTWIGVIQETDDARAGAVEGVLTGRQTLVAFGLEVLLRRVFVTRSIVADGAGEKQVNHAIEFNAENDRTNTGNRSQNRGPNGTYLFAEDLDNAAYWSTVDIVEYLIHYFRPLDDQGVSLIDFRLAFSGFSRLPNWDRPRKDVHGMTLDQVLLDLIDRSRFLAWTVDVDETQAPVLVDLNVFTFAEQFVTLPSGANLLPNAALKSIDFDTAVWAGVAPIRTSETHRVDRVTVRGSRATGTFTVSPIDGTLTNDWTAAQETSYEAGHSGDAGYAALDVNEQERANDLVRSDDALAKVFSCFKLPVNWDGLVNDGENNLGVVVWFPAIGTDGGDDQLNPEPFYRPAFRLLNELPALRQQAVAGEAAEEKKPLALVKLATDRYAHAEQLGRLAGVEGEADGGGIKYSAHLRVASHDAAVWLRVSGAPQHMLASADFTALAGGEDDRWLPDYNWRDNLILTVAAESRYVEVSAEAGNPTDAVREVVIDLRDSARLDWIAEGTVTGIEDDGSLVRQAAGEFKRDDRPRMRDLAALALAWYGTQRIAFELGIRQHFAGLAVGDLVTSIGAGIHAKQTNSVVTAVTYNLADGGTTISTEFADINFRALIVG